MAPQILSGALALLIAIASGYAASHSTSSIPKLQTYEEKAQKAAEWSNAAEKRLNDTRRTVGAGLFATMASCMSAVSYFMLITLEQGNLGEWVATRWPALLSFVSYGVMVYMRRFWGNKAKVPFMDDYNVAISDSMLVIKFLSLLSVAWAGVAGLRVLGL